MNSKTMVQCVLPDCNAKNILNVIYLQFMPQAGIFFFVIAADVQVLWYLEIFAIQNWIYEETRNYFGNGRYCTWRFYINLEICNHSKDLTLTVNLVNLQPMWNLWTCSQANGLLLWPMAVLVQFYWGGGPCWGQLFNERGTLNAVQGRQR